MCGSAAARAAAARGRRDLRGDAGELREVAACGGARGELCNAQLGGRVEQELREHRTPRQLEVEVLGAAQQLAQHARPALARAECHGHVRHDQPVEDVDGLNARLVRERVLELEVPTQRRALEGDATAEVALRGGALEAVEDKREALSRLGGEASLVRRGKEIPSQR